MFINDGELEFLNDKLDNKSDDLTRKVFLVTSSLEFFA